MSKLMTNFMHWNVTALKKAKVFSRCYCRWFIKYINSKSDQMST